MYKQNENSILKSYILKSLGSPRWGFSNVLEKYNRTAELSCQDLKWSILGRILEKFCSDSPWVHSVSGETLGRLCREVAQMSGPRPGGTPCLCSHFSNTKPHHYYHHHSLNPVLAASWNPVPFINNSLILLLPSRISSEHAVFNT